MFVCTSGSCLPSWPYLLLEYPIFICCSTKPTPFEWLLLSWESRNIMGYNDEPYRVEYIWVCQKHSKTRWLAKRPSQSSGLALVTCLVHDQQSGRVDVHLVADGPMANNWVTDGNWLDTLVLSICCILLLSMIKCTNQHFFCQVSKIHHENRYKWDENTRIIPNIPPSSIYTWVCLMVFLFSPDGKSIIWWIHSFCWCFCLGRPFKQIQVYIYILYPHIISYIYIYVSPLYPIMVGLAPAIWF